MGRAQEITHPYQERLTCSCHPYRSQFPGPSCLQSGREEDKRGLFCGGLSWASMNGVLKTSCLHPDLFSTLCPNALSACQGGVKNKGKILQGGAPCPWAPQASRIPHRAIFSPTDSCHARPQRGGETDVCFAPPAHASPVLPTLHSSYFPHPCVFPYSFDLSTRTNYVKFQ